MADDHVGDLSPEEQKEVDDDEAFAVAEQKMRTFVQARQAVKASNLSKGSYPFTPQFKGGTFNGKKGKSKAESKGLSSSSTGYAAEEFLGVAAGDPSCAGCFSCGDKDHDFRSFLLNRSSSQGGEGKKMGA